MNSLDKQYQALLQDILDNGVKKETRNGKVLSVFGRSIRYKFKDGKFPLLTTKKMAWKTMVTELLWFLRGDTSIEYLLKNDCNIWTGDAYKNYSKSFLGYEDIPSQEWFINEIKTNTEFAKRFGELGKIYGYQWRNWNGSIDQISDLIKQLKENPDSRRLLVSAWNSSDLPHQVLPPCHYGFQVYTRELSVDERMDYWFENNKPNRDVCDSVDESPEEEQHKYFDGANVPQRAISLMFNMRSNDVPLGLPFNLASYGLLLEIIGRMVNMIPDELIGNLGDAHIYNNQVEGVKEQLTREPYELPTLRISSEVNFDESIDDFLNSCDKDSFKLDGYESHPPIKIPLSN